MSRKTRGQKGQSLLETMVALAIGLLVITGFVSLGVISLRNSRVSSDQATATKLAQEGIEAMITIRDQNSPGAIQNMGATNQWTKLFATGAGQVDFTCTSPSDLTSNCIDLFLLEGTCSLSSAVSTGPTPTPTQQRCIQRNTTSSSDSSWNLSSPNAKFSRKVRITGGAADIKDVTVFVWWTDSIGLHSSVLSRKLTKDKL